jgi:hypothetical protein
MVFIVFEFPLRGKPLFRKGIFPPESDNIKILLYSFQIPLAPGRFLGSGAEIGAFRGDLHRFGARIAHQGGTNDPLRPLSCI